MAVRLFVAQLFYVGKNRDAIGKRGGDGKNRILIDRPRNHFRLHFDSSQWSSGNPKIRHLFSRGKALVGDFNSRPHAP
jgi:hypothetical protein